MYFSKSRYLKKTIWGRQKNSCIFPKKFQIGKKKNGGIKFFFEKLQIFEKIEKTMGLPKKNKN